MWSILLAQSVDLLQSLESSVQDCAEKVLFCQAPARRNKAELSRNLATFLSLNPVIPLQTTMQCVGDESHLCLCGAFTARPSAAKWIRFVSSGFLGAFSQGKKERRNVFEVAFPSIRRSAPLYRDGLKGGPVLLSNSQAGEGRNFTQPRAHLLVNPSMYL